MATVARTSQSVTEGPESKASSLPTPTKPGTDSIAARMLDRGMPGERLIRINPAATPSTQELFDDMPDPLSIRVRSFRADDADAVRVLYEDGLLGGQLAANDTGIDLDDVDAAYFSTGTGHFWVAVDDAGRVVGTVGVQSHEEGVGEIRRLRVDPDCRRRGVGSKLLEQAIRFCRESNFLKIMLDTHIEREPAIKLFEKLHFRHGRTRDTNGKQLLVFYLDLYSDDA